MARSVVVGDFEWDPSKAMGNRRKHGVSFEEAVTVFSDPQALSAPDLYEAELLFIVHAEIAASGRVRIISARKASRAQRRKYEEA